MFSATSPFASAAPRVELLAAFARPYEQAVAAARTCYSGKGVVSVDDVSGYGLAEDKAALRQEQRDRIAASTWKAGHHTILQHGHVQFALDHVSRQFVWSFLHSHPWYNSEQVSQRYVEVKSARAAVPRLPAPLQARFEAVLQRQMADYQALIGLLEPVAEALYFQVFPARAKRPDAWRSAIHKRAQEVARYALPVATHTWLVHTVSVLTLLRYRRQCMQPDAPAEARYVVDEMCRQLFALDPLLQKFEVEPIPQDELTAWRAFASPPSTAQWRQHVAEFDAELGGKVAVLTDRFGNNQRRLADAVRQVLGLPRAAMSDEAAIGLALDPAQNRLLGETLNTTDHDKLGRSLHAAHYAFAKKLSHAADSQDQRHRTTPGARPLLLHMVSPDPDYITPKLVLHAGGEAERRYHASMQQSWDDIAALRQAGVEDQWLAYLLPNAVSVRFTETADLAALRHKHLMRLCLNAQEEIWQASVDEADAIVAEEPLIGRHLLPPCGVRHAAGIRPYCPEGDRYCGVPVWTLPRAQWDRVL